MADKYAVVRTDLMSGTVDGAHLRSGKFFAEDKEAPIENGNVVKLVALMEGEREVFKAVAPEEATELRDCVLVATPEVMYDERKHNLYEFRNEKGEIFRGYRFVSGNIFSCTVEAFEGVPTVGATIGLMAGTKFAVGGAGTVVGKCIAIEMVDGAEFYVVEVK